MGGILCLLQRLYIFGRESAIKSSYKKGDCSLITEKRGYHQLHTRNVIQHSSLKVNSGSVGNCWDDQ
jgi:hypothetical protein